MWWLFTQKNNNENYIEYNYSRESEKLDGSIVYEKKSGIATITVPCASDKDNDWDQNKALGKFMAYVVNEGFPKKRRVVIG